MSQLNPNQSFTIISIYEIFYTISYCKLPNCVYIRSKYTTYMYEIATYLQSGGSCTLPCSHHPFSLPQCVCGSIIEVLLHTQMSFCARAGFSGYRACSSICSRQEDSDWVVLKLSDSKVKQNEINCFIYFMSFYP